MRGNNVGYKHFTKYDRIRIESWLRAGMTVKFIASELGKSLSSIYREIKRGAYEHTLYDLTTETRYSSDLADIKYRENLKNKGAGLKIGNDIAYAAYLEYKIHDCKYSPAAALASVDSDNLHFHTKISRTTLYRYIDQGLFLTLTNKDLPVKRNKSKNKHKFVRASRAPHGKSIEQRPDNVLQRNDFGNWEMDCVVGRRKTKNVLLVLTERLTRKELIYKMPDKSKGSVVDVIDQIQHRFGTSFSRIFRTITCDNGVEFADAYRIQHDASGNKRVDLYYCHPYSSCERGSNENQNRLIRRHFLKGCSFSKVTRTEIARVENWINNYPRKLFGWHTANEMFDAALKSIGI